MFAIGGIAAVQHQITFAQWQARGTQQQRQIPYFAARFGRNRFDWCGDRHAPLPEQEAVLHQVRDIQPGSSGIVASRASPAWSAMCAMGDPFWRARSRVGVSAHPMRHELRSRRRVVLWQSAIASTGCRVSFQSGSPEPPMQDTLGEFQRSQLPQRSCQTATCPAARTAGPAATTSTRCGRKLKRVIEGREHLKVVLHARGVGHQPRPAILRAYQLDICTDPDCEQLLLTSLFSLTLLPAGTATRSWWRYGAERSCAAQNHPGATAHASVQYSPSPAIVLATAIRVCSPSTEPEPRDGSVGRARARQIRLGAASPAHSAA